MPSDFSRAESIGKCSWLIPGAPMSTEVFAALGDLGGPGYLAALLALTGILILAIGLGTVVLGLYLFFFR